MMMTGMVRSGCCKQTRACDEDLLEAFSPHLCLTGVPFYPNTTQEYGTVKLREAPQQALTYLSPHHMLARGRQPLNGWRDMTTSSAWDLVSCKSAGFSYSNAASEPQWDVVFHHLMAVWCSVLPALGVTQRCCCMSHVFIVFKATSHM